MKTFNSFIFFNKMMAITSLLTLATIRTFAGWDAPNARVYAYYTVFLVVLIPLTFIVTRVIAMRHGKRFLPLPKREKPVYRSAVQNPAPRRKEDVLNILSYGHDPFDLHQNPVHSHNNIDGQIYPH